MASTSIPVAKKMLMDINIFKLVVFQDLAGIIEQDKKQVTVQVNSTLILTY